MFLPFFKKEVRSTRELICSQPHLSPLEGYEESPRGSYYYTSYGQEGDWEQPAWTFAKVKSCLTTLMVAYNEMTGCKNRITMDVVYQNFGLVSYISPVAKLGRYALSGCTAN